MDKSKLKQCIDSNVWLVYLLTFVIGCVASSFISLYEEPKEKPQSIIVNPSKPIVVRDTIRVEHTKWRTRIIGSCCPPISNSQNGENQTIQNQEQEIVSPKTCQEATSSACQMEGTSQK